MGYRSREKKRRRKAAIASTKRQYSTGMDTRYYLTLVKHPCRCKSCGGKLGPGADMVYRHTGPVTLCVPCADRDPLVEYRPSLRWEQRKGADLERRARKAAKKPVSETPAVGLWDKAA
jgi:hypothetical protein